MVDTVNAVSEDGPNVVADKKHSVLRFIRKFFYWVAVIVFWLWQIAFVVLTLFTLAPHFLPGIWEGYRYGDMPIHYFLLTVALIVLPLICIGIICWLCFSGKSNRGTLILKFFYGFELPILILLGIYLTNLRDYGVGMSWILVNTFVALAMWMFLIVMERRWCSRTQKRVPVFHAESSVAMVGSTVLFAMGLFVSIGMLLFVVPMVFFISASLWDMLGEISWSAFSFSAIWQHIVNVDWTNLNILYVIPYLAGMLLFLSSVLLIAVLPFALIYLYVGQYIRRLLQSPSSIKMAITVGVLVLLVVVHFYSNRQPQEKIFAILETQPQSDKDRLAVLAQSENIRNGLLNAYLARYRYFSSTGSASVLVDIYSEVFKVEGSFAEKSQELLNVLLMPILYDGDNRIDVERAAQAYEAFFDVPIQKAEVDEIWRTLDYNMEESAQNAAGLLDVNQQTVHMQSQSINLDIADQLATVTITQKLINESDRLQEAVVHFSLPEYAVVTGVWLSHAQSDLKFNKFLVSPRGAAQAVYTAQVRRRIDPALLEKVGPELYRLRVYPILAGVSRRDRTKLPEKPMFVTFEYQTLANSKGEWPMPYVLEQRQIYWDTRTVDTVNGEAIDRNVSTAWVPAAAGSGVVIKPEPIKLSNDGSGTSWAVPVTGLDTTIADNVVTLVDSNSQVAVLIDGSRSMDTYQLELMKSVEQLVGAKLYFCQLTCAGVIAAELSDKVYWGNSKPIEQLQAFFESGSNAKFDTIIMLTDNGSYEAEDNNQKAVMSTLPVWVLHVGGKRPYAYSDSWLSTVNRSAGGFSHHGINELLVRAATIENANKLRFNDTTANLLGVQGSGLLEVNAMNKDWLWLVASAPTSTSETKPLDGESSNIYAKLDASIRIAQSIKRTKKLGLEQLDELHRIAGDAGIVTEMSSMIVLVNDRQREALKEAEKQDDRFNRENEDGAQTVGVPMDSLSVPAVPEPREWAMLLIVLAFLSVSLYRRRFINS